MKFRSVGSPSCLDCEQSVFLLTDLVRSERLETRETRAAVNCVSRAFHSTDQEERDTARSPQAAY